MEDTINCAILLYGCFAKEYLVTGIDRTLHYSDDNRTQAEIHDDMIKASKAADNLPDEVKKKNSYFVYPYHIYGCCPPKDSPFYDTFKDYYKK